MEIQLRFLSAKILKSGKQEWRQIPGGTPLSDLGSKKSSILSRQNQNGVSKPDKFERCQHGQSGGAELIGCMSIRGFCGVVIF